MCFLYIFFQQWSSVSEVGVKMRLSQGLVHPALVHMRFIAVCQTPPSVFEAELAFDPDGAAFVRLKLLDLLALSL